MLAHPAHQAAVLGVEGKDKVYHVGKPELFPSIQVNNKDQEEEYRAKGYLVEGSSDMAAYDSFRASIKPNGYSYDEYPKWIKVDGENVLAKDLDHECALTGKNAKFLTIEEVTEVSPVVDNIPKKRGRPKSDKMKVDA
jgi:hypothetical protein